MNVFKESCALLGLPSLMRDARSVGDPTVGVGETRDGEGGSEWRVSSYRPAL